MTTYSGAEPLRSRVVRFEVSTDANGAITNFVLVLHRWQSAAPPVAGDRVDIFVVSLGAIIAVHNVECTTVGASPFNGVPNACLANSGDGGTSGATSPAGALPILVVAPASIPTLSEWALILLALALAGHALWTARRQGLSG